MYIAVEGIDGSGKSTQSRILAEQLRAAGADVVLTREPTDGRFGKLLREAARAGVRLLPRVEYDFFVADRREHVLSTVRPAMARGAIVITDRSYYSSAAYQGARGFLVEAILAENEAFAPRPDRVLFLDLPLDVALERCARRGSDAFERAEELAAVQRNYWRLARERSFYVVSTDGAEATVSASIMEVVGSWS